MEAENKMRKFFSIFVVLVRLKIRWFFCDRRTFDRKTNTKTATGEILLKR